MIFLTFGLSFGILGLRGIRLHTKPDNKLQNLADSQYTEKVSQLPMRGNIYDRRGHELAVSVPSYSLAVHPHLVDDPSKLASHLSHILDMNAKTIRHKMAAGKKFAWLKRRLMPGEVDRIKKMQNPALSLVKESRRYYPNRELASQVLGAAGYDSEALGGLELQYDKYLKAPEVREVAFRDAHGAVFETSEDPLEPQDVGHLHLTIDRNIQYVAETELATAAHRLKVKHGTVIVLDSRTGEVLAMASYPRFNPNTYQDYRLDSWRNVGVTDVFEPGSVFKVVAIAAALEKGEIDVKSRIFCENGRLRVGHTVIRDHEKFGELTVAEILKFSSNIGTAKIANRVGKRDFYKMIRRFGFGETTGLDFPGEIGGEVRDPKEWYPIDLDAIAFGQSIYATPLQVASAYATIANGGKRMKPYLVSRVVHSNGETIYEAEPKSLGVVIQPETAKTLTRLLEGVTHKGGTGTAAAIPGYRVAGKTGTAQKYDHKAKAYSHSDYYASFVGFAPADNPRLVVYVGLDDPEGHRVYGGQIAAPIFRSVMSAALYQLKIPPEQRTLPLFEAAEGASPNNKVLEKNDNNRADKGDSGHSRPSASRVVPDFSGLSIQQAMSLVEGRGLTLDIEGSGVAYEQDPLPGRTLAKGDICRVYFKKSANA